MGRVVDPIRAQLEPCRCTYFRGKYICWVPGVIGMLTQEQVKRFCLEKGKIVFIKRGRS